MQREAKKQMQETGIGTKSQQALKLQQEQNKQERKVRSREKKEADELRMFELKQQKKREKHRGHQSLGLLLKFQFVEDLMNPCNIGRCMNVNLRCLMY